MTKKNLSRPYYSCCYFPWLIILLTILLNACADDPKIKQPVELTSFKTDYYLAVDWQSASGTGVEQQALYLQPLLLDKQIITVSYNGLLTQLNRNNGEEISQTPLETNINAGVGGDENNWVLATEDAHILFIDAKTKKVLWKKRVPTVVLTTPVLNDDSVIVRTIDGTILNLNKTDGKIRWQFHRAVPDLSLHGTGDIIIARDKILLGFADGHFMALSLNTGDVIWDNAVAIPKGRSEVQRLVDLDGRIELYGHTLYATSFQGKIIAIDVSSGQLLWTRNFSSYTGLTVDEKSVYTSDDKGNLWALDRENGATLWKQEKLNYRKLSTPTVVGSYLAIGDYDGYVHLLSRFDGHFIARYQMGQYDDKGWEHEASVIVPPITLADEKVLLHTQGGGLYALSLRKKLLLNDVN